MNNSLRFPHLLKASLLNDLPDDKKVELIDLCSVRSFPKQEVVLAQGESTSGMFMVAHGTIEVSYMSEDGHKSIIYHAGEGDALGAIEAIADRPCAATCVAFPNTTVLFCATPLLFEQLKSPVMIRNLAVIFHDMMTRDNMFKSVDQFYSVEQKICVYLHDMSSRNSKFTQSQSYLANVVGCSRQTVNRELGTLRDMNIIDISKGAIGVLDQDALARRIEDLDLSQSSRKN
ncbi:Crp/Fnr family transcriptional regulator [Litoreibacter roseus]|uniref:Crp/Fnr family transcriptional regulator n=1 Tax=Litoreibacter roseus TaxID=2601869 RepID=A0A6N6JDB8_9RHOB|nr:Crp/Fnr family transcriptional regulator [Litoreibacter roseus]GFE64114.1 hypothetical protein KIN_11880 [Litoreibacter roseus]